MESAILPFWLHIFLWKKILVKFHIIKKIVGEIRGENIRGWEGKKFFFNVLPTLPRKIWNGLPATHQNEKHTTHLGTASRALTSLLPTETYVSRIYWPHRQGWHSWAHLWFRITIACYLTEIVSLCKKLLSSAKCMQFNLVTLCMSFMYT